MSVVLGRPYEFMPPHRGDGWPWLIQKLRLTDRYVRKHEGIQSHECRGLQHLRDSLAAGDGILLAPNHCRYADPLVLAWPAREVRCYVHAMASWHLFNRGWWDAFAIRKCGGFSIYREGPDRQSLQTAIELLAAARRPLIVYPEGTTNRTNDVLSPLLDGVTFIARSAARRRAKQDSCSGRVVILPVAVKYLCKADIGPWAGRQLGEFEERLNWSRRDDLAVLPRTIRLVTGMLALREVEYLGGTGSGSLPQRRQRLMQQMLSETEQQLGLATGEGPDIRARLVAIRTAAVNGYADSDDPIRRAELERHVRTAALIQDLWSFPDCYIDPEHATDTRIMETIQRVQETVDGRADGSMPLHAVIQFDTPIVVPAEKAPRGGPDPVLLELAQRLERMLQQLAAEARPIHS